MTNSVSNWKMVNTEGQAIEERTGASCVGCFSAYELSRSPRWLEFLQNEVVTLRIEWHYYRTWPRRVVALAQELCPFTIEQTGNVVATTHQIQGVPFDRVIASIRILRYLDFLPYAPSVQTYGCVADWINLQAPTVAQLKAFDFVFDEDGHDVSDVQEALLDGVLWFDNDVAKARIVSLTSGKKKTFNEPLYPPLGGPNGCIGYFKDYQVVGYFKTPEHWFDNYMGGRVAFMKALKKFCDNLQDDATISVDNILMCHGKSAESTMTKKFANDTINRVLETRWDEVFNEGVL